MVSRLLTFITGRLNQSQASKHASNEAIKQDDQSFISI